MKTYSPEQPLISIHIPKCAGTSFSNVLKSWFKRRYQIHYPNEKRNKPPKKHNLYTNFFGQKRRSGLCIHGHFNNDRGNGPNDYYPEADQLITILRDPFDLHLSTYFFVKRAYKEKQGGEFRNGKLHPIIQNDWDLETYLKEVRKSYICSFLPSNITIDNYREILENQFIYIGISEQLQHSVDILSKKLGFPKRTVPIANVSKRTQQIPKNAREEFEENNPLEMAIYKLARNNWGNKLQ